MSNGVQGATRAIILSLYNDGRPDKAVLASLRGASSIESPKAQNVVPFVVAHLDESQLSHTGKPTYAENAVFAALRMYAIHQQGNDSYCVYASQTNKSENGDGNQVVGISLFAALSRLRASLDDSQALDRRMRPLLATTNYGSLVNSLTHLVGIMKATKQPFIVDYARLAQELCWFQMSYEQANRVRLVWGQSYYRVTKQDKGKGENDND
jgi:CRISPR system Cascade subunit CasB